MCLCHGTDFYIQKDITKILNPYSAAVTPPFLFKAPPICLDWHSSSSMSFAFDLSYKLLVWALSYHLYRYCIVIITTVLTLRYEVWSSMQLILAKNQDQHKKRPTAVQFVFKCRLKARYDPYEGQAHWWHAFVTPRICVFSTVRKHCVTFYGLRLIE